ncbi:MAG TPA: response regulator [Sphingomicrobium sp.]
MAPQSDTDSLTGTRVLVVEDEYYLADDLSRTLKSAGAEVVGPVATLADAERLVDAEAFDCAVVDMNLRGDFAFEFAERLTQTGIPFIVTTGYNSASLPDRLKDVPRIEKPFSPTEVVEQLSRMIPGETFHT